MTQRLDLSKFRLVRLHGKHRGMYGVLDQNGKPVLDNERDKIPLRLSKHAAKHYSITRGIPFEFPPEK